MAGGSRGAIVLAPGTYGGERPYANPHGHQLYAARLGTAILTAGLSLGGHEGHGGGLVRGLVIDVRDARQTVDGAGIAVWGTGRGSRILDTTLRGHGEVSAGIAARRPEGLVIQRVVVRRFQDFGVLVDANDPNRPEQRDPFQISDLDVAGVARPTPGSSQGRAEASVWIGDTGSVRHVRARSCAGSGLWTGTATRRASFEAIDVDDAATGVYIEHFTTDSTFRALRIGPRVRVGLNAEWADPAWERRPASVGNVIEGSRFESWLVGVYLDEGTTRTTVRRNFRQSDLGRDRRLSRQRECSRRQRLRRRRPGREPRPARPPQLSQGPIGGGATPRSGPPRRPGDTTQCRVVDREGGARAQPPASEHVRWPSDVDGGRAQ